MTRPAQPSGDELPASRVQTLLLGSVRVGCLALLSAVWANSGTPRLVAQFTSQATPIEGVAISGHVVTPQRLPVENAHVALKSLDNPMMLNTNTDASGSFTFTRLAPGSYAINSDQGAVHSAILHITIRKGVTQNLIVVLGGPENSAPNLQAGEHGSSQEMQFSDAPNFTVAGVTDWTAVGGHGSDATLRTSEDLTRETLGLKAPRPQKETTLDSGQSGNNLRAENSLRAALALAPRSYAANNALGIYYLQAARFREAAPLLQTASELDGGKARDEYHVALACQGLDDFVQARDHVERALRHDQAADYYRLLGSLDEQLSDPLSAVHNFERATQLDPVEENYFYWASELLLHPAIWQADEVFAQGAKAHPDSVRMKTGWGAALFAGALYDDAATQLCKASDLNPAATEPYIFLGKVASASQTPPACVKQRLERFVELQPDNPEANYWYATFLLKQSDPSQLHKADTFLRKAVALNPQHADGYLQLGILSLRRKNYPEAIDFFVRAIGADPTQAEPYYRLAVAYDRIGESELAKQQFRLHDDAEAAQARATEEQRRQVKQFLVVLKGSQSDPLNRPE